MVSVEEKLHLIKRNLQEVLGEERLINILKERDLHIYWGTATTGRPHIGYFLPLTKIFDFLQAGCNVTILIADLHGYLDNMKSPWDMLQHRSVYYEEIIKNALESIGNRLGLKNIITKLKFVRGTDYQLSREYTLDMYRLSSVISQHDAKKAGTEVVKQTDNAALSSLLYPGLQALDEKYLKVDAQFGGVDQRKIFTFAEKYMPLIGHTKQIHLMNPMLPGISGSKMSSSDLDSKIDLLDDLSSIKRKIKKCFCEPGNIEKNGLLDFIKFVLIPLNPEFGFSLTRRDGTVTVYKSHENLENDFRNEIIHPGDLKNTVTNLINEILTPIREKALTKEMEIIINKAYPKLSIKKKPSNNTILVNPTILDLRVGLIEEVQCPEGVDSLYLLIVNMGECGVRPVVTNIRKMFTVENLIHKKIAFLCNLKPTKFRGIESNGMIVSCSSDSNAVNLIEFKNSKPGSKIFIENYFNSETPTILNPKKKLWEKIIGQFKLCNGKIVYHGEIMKSENENGVQLLH